MSDTIVSRFDGHVQDIESTCFVQNVVFYKDGTIWCPMCDARHENSTMCQMSMEGY